MLLTDADLIKYRKFAVAELSPWYQPRTLEGIASELSRTEARIASTSARIARIEAWLLGLPDKHERKLDAIHFVWQWRDRLSDLRCQARSLREEMERPLPTAQEMATLQYIDERLADIEKAYCFDRPKDGKAFTDGVRLQIETLEDPDDLRCEYWREEHEAAKEEAERSWLDGNPYSEEIQRKLDLTRGAMETEEEMLRRWEEVSPETLTRFILKLENESSRGFKAVPQELKELRRWITWRSENGTKVPNCKWQDPTNWRTFEEVKNEPLVGFVFVKEDGYVGIDLDDCIEGLFVSEFACGLLQELSGKAYAEISPSGTGIKLWTRGRKPEGARSVNRAKGLEVYDSGRWFAVTGNSAFYAVDGFNVIRDGQEAIDAILSDHLDGTKASRPAPALTRVKYETELMRRASDYVDRADTPSPGDRNNSAFRLAGNLFAMIQPDGERLSMQDVLGVMTQWNSRLPVPLDQQELEATTKSAATNGTPREDKLSEAPCVRLSPRGRVEDDRSAQERSTLRDAYHEDQLSEAEDLRGLGDRFIASWWGWFQSQTFQSVDEFHKATGEWRLLGEDEAKMILHAKAYDEANAAKQADASQDLYHVPGLVEGIMRLTLESAAYPSRELAFCGAIALVSLLTGRKVTLWGKYTNVYLIGIASSATGKDIPRKVNKKLLKDLGMGDCLNESLASGEGLEDAMIENPLCLLQVDEMDHLIRAMAGARESRFASISERLLTMFTSSDGDFYCRVKAGMRRSIISRPHLVLFGTCTPKAFWESLGEDMLSNGLFARMLTVEVERRSDRQKPRGIDPDPALLEELAYWRDFDAGKMASDTEAGNLAGVLSEVYEIPADEDAIAPLTQALDRFDAEYRRCEDNRDEAGKSIWGRAGEYSLKLAAIYACSIASGKPPRITSDAVRWATRFMEHHTAKMLESAKDRVAQTDFAKNAAKVLDRIKASRDGVPHSKLLRDSHLTSKEFNEIIKTLIESGQVKTAKRGKGIVYVLASLHGEE